MTKIKTHKATSKRFQLSNGKTRKLKKRKAGQDHFNARADGNKTQKKRRDIDTHKSIDSSIRNLMPYD